MRSMRMILVAFAIGFSGCGLDIPPPSERVVSELIKSVRCKLNNKGICFCFVVLNDGIGMTIDQTGKACE